MSHATTAAVEDGVTIPLPIATDTNEALDNTATATATAAMPATATAAAAPFLQLSQLKKKKRKRPATTAVAVADDFGGDDSLAAAGANSTGMPVQPLRTEPLVIAVQPNTLLQRPPQHGAATTASSSTTTTTKMHAAETNDPATELSSATQTARTTPSTTTDRDNDMDDATKEAMMALVGDRASNDAEKETRVIAARPSTFGSSTTTTGSGTKENTVKSTAKKKSTGVSDAQQYQQDLDALPQELEETADAYRMVPIAEFGAALLRGMGWQGDDTGKNNNNNSTNNGKRKTSSQETPHAMPRPHRLGLGAIPAALADSAAAASSSNHRRGRRPDQFKKDQAVAKQQQMYEQQRQDQLAADRQRTLQNGSIVYLVDNKEENCNTKMEGDRSSDKRNERRPTRARIVKLVGVPGLNMVQVLLEGYLSSDTTTVKRRDLDGLVPRKDLQDRPFRAGTPPRNPKRERNDAPEHDKARTVVVKREDRSDAATKTAKKRRRDERPDDRRSPSKSSKKAPTTWLTPHIRVRIITQKLGRRHYEQKAVVVDVTRQGTTATVQVDERNNNNNNNNGTRSATVLLDNVPERYLETALPRRDGPAVVLRGPHQHKQGRLLERDRRKAVLQVWEDLSILELSLDDVAEWCGPVENAV